ncbi:MAG TPA: DUF4105 domain-containing protein [Rhodanobacteraceae bacterium]|nr:DUF4105 domain-containing protein [Rhodanobacteraceae bacterium]
MRPRRLRRARGAAVLWLGALLALWGALAAPAPAAAQAAPGSALSVSLLTFGPGEIYWERFGHNAIRIRDAASGSDVAYNYGIFDFGEDDFLLNFARGRMQYRIAADATAEDLALYAQEGRWIVEQALALTPAQRQALRDYLEWNLRPENARYRYDYFTANCSTRVRDALDRALGGALHAQLVAPSSGFTYRMHADRLMRPDLALMLGIDVGLGPLADRRLSFWDESFVPMLLMQRLREVRVPAADGTPVPLVQHETLLASPRLAEPADFPPDLRWPCGALGLGLAALLLALARRRGRAAARGAFAFMALSTALLCGLGGLVLAALWGLTEHTSAWRNANLLLLDPLCLLLLPAWWRARRADWRPSRTTLRLAQAIALLAAAALCLRVLPWFVQDNRPWIALLLPLHFALLLALRRIDARPG